MHAVANGLRIPGPDADLLADAPLMLDVDRAARRSRPAGDFHPRPSAALRRGQGADGRAARGGRRAALARLAPFAAIGGVDLHGSTALHLHALMRTGHQRRHRRHDQHHRRPRPCAGPDRRGRQVRAHRAMQGEDLHGQPPHCGGQDAATRGAGRPQRRPDQCRCDRGAGRSRRGRAHRVRRDQGEGEGVGDDGRPRRDRRCGRRCRCAGHSAGPGEASTWRCTGCPARRAARSRPRAAWQMRRCSSRSMRSAGPTARCRSDRPRRLAQPACRGGAAAAAERQAAARPDSVADGPARRPPPVLRPGAGRRHQRHRRDRFLGSAHPSRRAGRRRARHARRPRHRHRPHPDPLQSPVVTASAELSGIEASGVAGSAKLDVSGPQNALALRTSAALTVSGTPAQITGAATLNMPGQKLQLQQLQVAAKGETARLLAPATVSFGTTIGVDRLRVGLRQAVLDVAGPALAAAGRDRDAARAGRPGGDRRAGPTGGRQYRARRQAHRHARATRRQYPPVGDRDAHAHRAGPGRCRPPLSPRRPA